MFSLTQFVRIATMQDSLNSVAAGTDWRDQNLAWDTAVLKEGTEALDHLGWEWWKKTTPNLEQAKIEIIDMLHFAMSGTLLMPVPPLLIHSMIIEASANMEPTQLAEISTWGADRFIKEAIVSSMVGNFPFAVLIITEAGSRLGMSTDDMFNAYIAKNILNRFRKANGYKEGTYFKIWDGREDNEHLTEIMNAADPAADDYETVLMDQLSARYAALTNKSN